MASLVNTPALANNANSTPITDWSSLLGAGIGAGVSLYGNSQATGALTGAEQAAIGTQQGAQGTIGSIYGNQTGLGNQADTALGAQLGVSGAAPNYSAFNNSPGYQFAVSQANQATDRTAAANGSLYTPNTLAMIGQNNAGYASANYNNYISQLMQSAGLGAQGNQGLASGTLQTSGNISQLQQNQGNAAAGGAANASGIAGNLLSRLPYGQIGSGVSSLFGGGANGNSIAGANASGVTQYGNGLDQGTSDQIANNATGWGPDLSSLGSTQSTINWGDDSGP
jgi:hypothetical protein